MLPELWNSRSASKRERRTAWPAWLVAVALLVVAAGPLPAQDLGLQRSGMQQGGPFGTMNPGMQGGEMGGLRLYSVSVGSSYSTMAIPNGGTFLQTVGFAQYLQSNINTVGAATIGWQRSKETNSFSILYTPSYSANARYPEWNTLNHRLQITGSRPVKLSRRWTLSTSLSANLNSLQQFFLSPTAYGSAVTSQAGFEELSSGMVQGKFTNDQLSSLLTGNSQLETPDRILVYGNRILTASLGLTLAYAYSPRLTVSFGVAGSRVQHLSDPVSARTPEYGYLLQQTTAANVNGTISYSLSPRSQVGGGIVTSRAFSSYQDAYVSSAHLFFSRRMGQNWFASVQGGTGFIRAVHATSALPRGPQYTLGGSLGYQVSKSQVLLFSVSRSISDYYGLGAGSTVSASGAWSWNRPGSHWGVYSSYGQNYARGPFNHIDSWRASAGLARSITRETAIQVGYGYMRYAGLVSNTPYRFAANTVNLSVVWAPLFALF